MSRCAKGKKDDIIKEERDSVVGEEDDFTQALKQVDKKEICHSKCLCKCGQMIRPCVGVFTLLRMCTVLHLWFGVEVEACGDLCLHRHQWGYP